MELSKVNQGFRDDEGNPIEDDTNERSRQESESIKQARSGLNYDTILDEIGQFGR